MIIIQYAGSSIKANCELQDKVSNDEHCQFSIPLHIEPLPEIIIGSKEKL